MPLGVCPSMRLTIRSLIPYRPGHLTDRGFFNRHAPGQAPTWLAVRMRGEADHTHRACQAVGQAPSVAVRCAAVADPILWWGRPTDTIQPRTFLLIFGPADHPERMRPQRRDEIAEPETATPPGSGSGR